MVISSLTVDSCPGFYFMFTVVAINGVSDISFVQDWDQQEPRVIGGGVINHVLKKMIMVRIISFFRRCAVMKRRYC